MDELAVRVAKKASGLPSIEDVVREWMKTVLEATLREIPSRYKQDMGKVILGTSASYMEIRCRGTSVRDLDVELTVGAMADPFRGDIRGSIWWEEVGMGKSETDVNLRAVRQSGTELVKLVQNVIAQQERG